MPRYTPDLSQADTLPRRRPSRYREIGEGPFGCVTVDPRDGSVTVRRFSSRSAAVLSMMRAQSAEAAGVGQPAPAAQGPSNDLPPEVA